MKKKVIIRDDHSLLHITLKNRNRKKLLFLFDTVVTAVSYFFCTLLAAASSTTTHLDIKSSLINFGILYLCIYASRLLLYVYTNILRYATVTGYLRLITADFCGGCAAYLISYISRCSIGLWRTVTSVTMPLILSIVARLFYQYLHNRKNLSSGKGVANVGIVGAGSVGAALANELLYNDKSEFRPKFFIDVDPAKIGGYVNDIKVLDGRNDDVANILKDNGIEVIIIAISGAENEKLNGLYELYSNKGFKVKIYDFNNELSGEKNDNNRHLRDIQVEDLLFRKTIEIPDEQMKSYSGKTVLVTGGGGSIGSEICRQIATLNPKRIVVFDIYENNAYDLQQELVIKYGSSLDLCVEIGSVRDRKRLDAVFSKYHPDIVFHAAAHKHVPLMEHSAGETIKNNVLGTYNTADMAEKYGVSKFVLISTDKAVNPTNIMGASKRMCEMIVQSRCDSKTTFAAVRFGNVLGSNGSVIPLFKKQIANGGPITITDKRIIRYFMTIPEASRLVLLAGAYAKGGELFVLDMGKPVKIVDLAENMIRLSGYEPYVDIEIKEIGLRPGEKLYEELLIKSETLTTTENSMIFVEKDTPLRRDEVEAKIRLLTDALEKTEGCDMTYIKQAYKVAVPSYRDPEDVNKNAEKSEEMKAVKEAS